MAVEHALVSTGASRAGEGLIHHSDRGSQYISLAYCDALAAGMRAWVGTITDSYDNAMAKTVNSLYTAELIHSQRVWQSAQAVEITTTQWVHWWNTTRLHQSLDYHTPQETQAAYNHHHDPTPVAP